MTDQTTKMLQPRSRAPFVIFTSVFIAVFTVVFVSNVAITFVLPESYASTARVIGAIAPDQSDAIFQKIIIDAIRSGAVLNPVIDHLELNTNWGKIYYNGQVFDTA